MEIYLDANATTPVLPCARAAALAAMAEDFGNPSSTHSTGLRARALIDGVRACASRVLGAERGRVLFVSGATEAIQTAVLSALVELLRRRHQGLHQPQLLLYGATEHKAVPEALKHWNALLGLNLAVMSIPVGRDGRHDLAWLRARAPRAGLICTMAANNETGVVSDLDGIQAALQGSPALWLVDGVQALGKLPLQLNERPIDYAAFSGHKLYAPKGIGMLYVREGAPFTPLMAGGGQEDASRAGTENMPGIAALGAVLAALEEGGTFREPGALEKCRERLKQALVQAFPALAFNAPLSTCLPTTLNFSVSGMSSKVLLDMFDAAGIRASGGSACSAAKAEPSYVLQAMGLPAWQSESAVRMSFGPAVDDSLIDQACSRIEACGMALRESCLTSVPRVNDTPPERLTRFVIEGACCYLLADRISMRCIVIDPLPELTARLNQWIRCRGYSLAAVLDTHSHGDHVSSAAQLRRVAANGSLDHDPIDALGWPRGKKQIALGNQRLTRLLVPGHTKDSSAYVLRDESGLSMAFVGDTVMPGALGRSDFPQSAPLLYGPSLLELQRALGSQTLLLPGHDYDDRFATTFGVECRAQPLLSDILVGRLNAAGFAAEKALLEQDLKPTRYQTTSCGARVDCDVQDEHPGLRAVDVARLVAAHPGLLLVDVREPYEQCLGGGPSIGTGVVRQTVPISSVVNALPGWLAIAQETPILFLCRSGNRSAKVARALRRLGRQQAYSIDGGLALWPEPAAELQTLDVPAHA